MGLQAGSLTRLIQSESAMDKVSVLQAAPLLTETRASDADDCNYSDHRTGSSDSESLHLNDVVMTKFTSASTISGHATGMENLYEEDLEGDEGYFYEEAHSSSFKQDLVHALEAGRLGEEERAEVRARDGVKVAPETYPAALKTKRVRVGGGPGNRELECGADARADNQ
ncbi:hypothetical protein NDU88_003032 [Pleurodeles waltl]|uniref:Uncharacterized protein n=1 Tax=Pleurodeles waltl TaxID=8319 RepID=A0AAV7Q7U9_PLEWA|nr:hypothetical protein NDU88_003032 [Pleurodeles waltl]